MLTHSTMGYLDSKQQKAAVEAARKKEATQTAKNVETARKKTKDLTNELHDVEQLASTITTTTTKTSG